IATLSVFTPGDSVRSSFEALYINDTPPFPVELHQSAAHTFVQVEATTGDLSIEADEIYLGHSAHTLANFNGSVHVIEFTATGTVLSSDFEASTFSGNDELSPFNDSYDGKYVEFTSGLHRGEHVLVKGYDGRTRTFTFDGQPIPLPAPGDTFRIYNPE